MPEQANKTPCSLGLLAHVDTGRCVPPEQPSDYAFHGSTDCLYLR